MFAVAVAVAFAFIESFCFLLCCRFTDRFVFVVAFAFLLDFSKSEIRGRKSPLRMRHPSRNSIFGLGEFLNAINNPQVGGGLVG